jgi:hypothetical protein
MSKIRLAWMVAGLASLTAACAARPEANVKAAAAEQLQCDRSSASGDDVRILQQTTVLSAGPLYSHVITKDSSDNRITGAKLLVRAPEGVSTDRLTRVLQCHSAQVLLGQVDPSRFADEPYWLPNTWLDIDVKSENGNFLVVLRADNIPDGLQVLHRATAFVDTHHATVDP